MRDLFPYILTLSVLQHLQQYGHVSLELFCKVKYIFKSDDRELHQKNLISKNFWFYETIYYKL